MESSCKNILIVEDDDDIRDLIALALEIEGYKVVGAANGKEGLDLLPKMLDPRRIPCAPPPQLRPILYTMPGDAVSADDHQFRAPIVFEGHGRAVGFAGLLVCL